MGPALRDVAIFEPGAVLAGNQAPLALDEGYRVRIYHGTTMRPIRLPTSSANQMAPSGPAVMCAG